MQHKRLRIYVLLAGLMLAAGITAGIASVESVLCHAGPAMDEGYGGPELVDCPAAMRPLVDRYYGCQHWGGEEPYDAERAAEIEAAVARLKCDVLDADMAAFRTQHADRPDVLGTLSSVVDASLEE